MDGRYISSTYYSFIPVENLVDGDLVVLNLPNFDVRKLKSIADIMAHVADLRAMRYMDVILKEKNVRVLNLNDLNYLIYNEIHDSRMGG